MTSLCCLFSFHPFFLSYSIQSGHLFSCHVMSWCIHILCMSWFSCFHVHVHCLFFFFFFFFSSLFGERVLAFDIPVVWCSSAYYWLILVCFFLVFELHTYVMTWLLYNVRVHRYMIHWLLGMSTCLIALTGVHVHPCNTCIYAYNEWQVLICSVHGGILMYHTRWGSEDILDSRVSLRTWPALALV